MNRSEKLWDRMSKMYDGATEKFGDINFRVVENTKKYLMPKCIVLEIGCGTGTMTLDIANEVKEVQAIDISSKMLDIAKRKALDNKIENIEFVQTTIFYERFTMESFDAILAFNVLNYLKDIQKSIERINELLKPGGLFISVTPCSVEKKTISSYLFGIFMSFLVKIRILPFIKFFRYSELDRIIAGGNFQIVETERLHGPEEHYFVMARKC